MYALWIIVLVTISLTATLAYTSFQSQKAFELSSGVQRNAAQMETAALLVKGMARPAVLGGPVRAPLGVEADGRQRPPALLAGRDRTPWGAPYGYCPASTVDPTATEAAVALAGRVAGGPDYAVEVVNGSSGPLVVGSARSSTLTFPGDEAPAPSDVIAFIVSPPYGKAAVPSCSEIAFRDGAFVIGGADTDGDGKVDGPPSAPGTVTAVRPDSPLLALGMAKERPTLYVAPTSSGRGDGSDAADPMDLRAAAAWWNAAPLDDVVLSLAGGRYDLTGLLRFDPAVAGRRMALSAREPGSEGAGRPVISSDTAMQVEFAADAAIRGIEFSGPVGMTVRGGAAVRIDGSRLSQLRVEGGTATLGPGTSIVHPAGHPYAPLEMTSGRVVLAMDELEVTAADVTDGAFAFVVEGGSLDVGSTDVRMALGVGGLPWKVGAGAALESGPGRDGALPTLRWGAQETVVRPRLSVTVECAGGFACTASCPVLTYAKAGGCSTPSGEGYALSSSGRQGDGWACRWTAVPSSTPEAMPAAASAPTPPASVSVTAECTANRN